jgi:hypothetical protein
MTDLKVLLLIAMIPLFVGIFAISAFTSRIVLLNMLTYDPVISARVDQINKRNEEIEQRLNQIQKRLQETK